MTSWCLTLVLFVSEKKPNRAKSYYSFHWKLKGYRALILTYLDIPMLFLILAVFRCYIGVKVGPKTQTLGTVKILCKNLSFSKSFKWHLHNYEDYPWSKFQLNLTLASRKYRGMALLLAMWEFLITLWSSSRGQFRPNLGAKNVVVFA